MNTLAELKNFPASICSRNTTVIQKEEKMYDSRIVIDNEIVKFLPLLNLEEIYLEQHNVSKGETWENHNKLFCNFIKRFNPNIIFEIGGGNGSIYNIFKTEVPWFIADLNPVINSNNNLTVYKKEFSPDDIQEGYTVISSHVFEHISNHEEFLLQLKNKNVKEFIFSIPNMIEYMNSFFPSLHFEHPVLLHEDYLEFLFKKTGWKLLDKKYYNNHSIFYCIEPIERCNSNFNFKLKDNIKNTVINFITFYKKRIKFLRNYQFYVFGCHFPVYYLLSLGLPKECILGIIDNDPKKQNKRMYGTDLMVSSLQNIPLNSNIVVEMGPYTEEIKKHLKQYTIL